MRGKGHIAAIILAAALIPGLECRAQFSSPVETSLSATSIPQAQQIQPVEVVQMLKAEGADRPLVLQVGSHVMFTQAHIPGAAYAGPGSQAAGLQLLERTVASAPKARQIVIYCGCCPWNKCPNMGLAYKRLHELGFNNLKALYIEKNFGDDWVAKGYPVEKGE